MDSVSSARARQEVWPGSDILISSTALSARTPVLVAAAAGERGELAGLIASAGCDPFPVVDGREALRLLQAGRYRLAVLAADLPGLTGLQILEELGRSGQQSVILVGPDVPELKRQAVWHGADRYLVRPIDPQQLVRAVGSVLASHPV